MLEETATSKPTLTKQDLRKHLENLRNNISTRKSQLSAAVEYYNALIELVSQGTEHTVSQEMLALVKSVNKQYGKLVSKK